jgi:hypothetical protein
MIATKKYLVSMQKQWVFLKKTAKPQKPVSLLAHQVPRILYAQATN